MSEKRSLADQHVIACGDLREALERRIRELERALREIEKLSTFCHDWPEILTSNPPQHSGMWKATRIAKQALRGEVRDGKQEADDSNS
jgi:hypothetical protein